MKKTLLLCVFLVLSGAITTLCQDDNSNFVPNEALVEVSEQTYLTLTSPDRSNIERNDPRLRFLPAGIGKLCWIVDNELATHPGVQSVNAQRWAVVELAGSDSFLDPKSATRRAALWIRFEAARATLEQSGTAVAVRRNRIATITQSQTDIAEPNDPLFGQQKDILNLANIRPLWNLDRSDNNIRTAKVAIVVMDTGIQCSHPDLVKQIDFVNSRSFTDSPVCEPVGYHGTMVAGVAGAEINNYIGIAGAAKNVPLLDWKIYKWGTNTEGGKILFTDEGIILKAFFATLGLPYERIILNCSFQLTDPDDPNHLWEKAIGALKDKVLVVAGAGNESIDTTKRDTFPGTLSKKLGNVICVGNIDKSGRPTGDTGYGDGVDLMAPGFNILSTSTDSSYGYASGVSFAIPHVSGVAAMISKYAPSFDASLLPSPAELKQAILKGSSLNLNLIGKIEQPRQINGWRSWLALTKQLGNEPQLATTVERLDDGDGNDIFTPAPYSWIYIYGRQLAGGYFSASQFPLPKTLGNVQVLVNNRPLPLLYVSPERVDAQMENDFFMPPMPQAKHTLTIIRVDEGGNPIVGSQTIPFSFTAIPANPVVRMLASDESQMMQVSGKEASPANQTIRDENPAKTGQPLKMLVSGLGRTTPHVQPGVPFDGTEQVDSSVELFFEGKPTPISVKTLAGAPGMFTVSFVMPQVSSLYSAEATLCAAGACNKYYFNYDGAGK